MSEQLDTFKIIKESLANYFAIYDIEDLLIYGNLEKYDEIDKIILYNYTGFVLVSGGVSGCILVSCDEGLLAEVIRLFLGPKIDLKEEYYIDMVGEITNTVAGYFQNFYSDNFILSSPSFLKKDQIADTKEKIVSPIQVLNFDLLGFDSKVLLSLS